MSVVAIYAGRMPIVVQQRVLGRIVGIRCCGERMPHLGSGILGEDAGRRRRDIRAAIVTADAVLLILSTKQPRRSLSIVRGVAANACVLRHGWVASKIRLGRNLVLHQGMSARGPI